MLSKFATGKKTKLCFENANCPAQLAIKVLKPLATKIVTGLAVSGATALAIADAKISDRKIKGTKANGTQNTGNTRHHIHLHQQTKLILPAAAQR